ncbi:MAG: 50S ribosomal protein P1 [Thermoplasmatales archaeon]|nr:50S ribosomal protein P1 [Thermoplasmatales archaeon]
MEYIYGAMLLHAAGKEINDENLKKVLQAAGIEIDDAKIKVLTSSLKGVNIDEIISKASSMPVMPVMPAEKKEEGKEKKEEKEEKKEEKKVSEEEIAAGLGALFG